MTTNTPGDEIGRPLSDAINKMDRHTERRAARSRRDDPWARWSARVNEKIAAQRASVANLASATGIELAAIRREFAKLEQQLADLRGELAVARRLDAITTRLDKLETPRAEPADAPSSRLRIASGPSLIA